MVLARAWRWMREHALASSLVAAALLRGVAAWRCYGWFTRDDYQQGIEQAYTWLHHPGASFAADIRSPLLSWGCMPFLALGEALGITDRADLVRCMYVGWGLFSLLAIHPVHRVAQRSFGRGPAAIAAWLMAAYAIMPAISVRAMIEVVAIVPLAWAVDFIDGARREDARRWDGAGPDAFFGAVLLSAATLMRFQLGLLFLPAAWTLRRRGRRALTGLALGAATGVVAQCLCDAAVGRPPLATPLAYVRFNLAHAAGYGTSPWYTYLLHFLLLMVPPAAFALCKPLARALGQQPWLCAILVVFVGVHSAVGHKEDRFMFSMLPVFFVLLAAALHAAWQGRAWERLAVWVFAGVNVIALGVTTLSDTHRSVTAPLVYLGRHAPAARVASVGFWTLPTYYLGDDADLHMFGDMDKFLNRPEVDTWDYIWLRGPGLDEQIAQVSAVTDERCRQAMLFSGDFADRVLVRVNRHNARRGPTALVRCEAPVN